MTPGPHLHVHQPATATSKQSGIQISNWRPLARNTLRGVFDAELPSGLIIRGVMAHERAGERWVGLPSKEWTDAQGGKRFTAILEFVSRDVANQFRDAVIVALDKYLEGLP